MFILNFLVFIFILIVIKIKVTGSFFTSVAFLFVGMNIFTPFRSRSTAIEYITDDKNSDKKYNDKNSKNDSNSFRHGLSANSCESHHSHGHDSSRNQSNCNAFKTRRNFVFFKFHTNESKKTNDDKETKTRSNSICHGREEG